jgi:hypothetical protein
MEGGPPDVFCDVFSMAQSAYGVAFTFSLSPSTPSLPGPGQANPQPQVIVRMSLESAKVLAMMLRKNLKQYELEHLGDPVKLPQPLLAELKLSEGDW